MLDIAKKKKKKIQIGPDHIDIWHVLFSWAEKRKGH